MARPARSNSSAPGVCALRSTTLVAIALLGLAFAAGTSEVRSPLLAQEYQRPVDAAPQPDDIGEGYALPPVQRPTAKAHWRHVLDVSLLAGAILLVAWVVLRKRNRRALVAITVFSLLYFGFYREGCVCPIGATQNVVVALTDPSYAIPLLVVIIFFLPLVLTLFVGRMFCGGVCPLGAIQDIVVVKPIQVPRALDRALGSIKYIYLGIAVWFAAQPAEARDFVICRFDPFVSFFRRTGSMHMFLFGGVLLLAGLWIGRIYCRYLCPYGAILGVLSRFSWRNVSITPDREIDCGLCSRACPFGAIEQNRASRSSCLACARCFDSCPLERLRRGRAPSSPWRERIQKEHSRETASA